MRVEKNSFVVCVLITHWRRGARSFKTSLQRRAGDERSNCLLRSAHALVSLRSNAALFVRGRQTPVLEFFASSGQVLGEKSVA